MKKPVLVWLIIIAVVGSALIGCSTPSPTSAPTQTPTAAPAPTAAKPIELILCWGDTKSPKTYAELDGPEGWIAEVEKATGGKVKITTYYIGELVPNNEVYDAVIKGTADLGALNHSATPGRFPATELLAVPPLNTTCRKVSQATWEYYKQFPEVQKEYAETKIISMFCRPPNPPGNVIGTTKKAVRTVEDMKGLKISAPGKTKQDLIKALGGSPMGLPPPEFYTSLQKGIIDGTTVDAAFYENYKLKELIRYQTNVNLGFGPWFFAVNWDTWNSLPPDVQKAFEETAPHVGDKADAYSANVEAKYVDAAVKEYGLELIDLSPEETKRWLTIQKPIIDAIIAERAAKGLPAQQLYDAGLSLFEKYDY